MSQGSEVQEIVQKWVTVPSAVGNSKKLWMRWHSEGGVIEISLPGRSDPVVVEIEQVRHALDLVEVQETES